jgi:hypothetical protein
LGNHPLVKKVTLPPIITQSSTVKSQVKGENFTVLAPDHKGSYPKICVVDGGVSDVYGDWIEDRWGLISSMDKDENHGTFIAGLAIFGQQLNGKAICREIDGCKIIDLDILPRADRYSSYYSKPLEFFNELETAVQELKARTGVRIFNFSLNIEEHASTTGYSVPAQILDKIAEENDVVFVISAGNTHPRDIRKEWPVDHFDALKILASSRNDAIKKPAESCRNISVSALNPPHLEGVPHESQRLAGANLGFQHRGDPREENLTVSRTQHSTGCPGGLLLDGHHSASSASVAVNRIFVGSRELKLQ